MFGLRQVEIASLIIALVVALLLGVSAWILYRWVRGREEKP
jgi:hypothetical protein